MDIIDRINYYETLRALHQQIAFLRNDPVQNAHLYTPEAKVEAKAKLKDLMGARSILLANVLSGSC